MLKIYGALIVVAACGLVGMIMSRLYIRRPQEIRNLNSALQMLETEISYSASPLAEAMKLVATRCDQHVAELFKQTGEELYSMTGYTAREAWNKSLESYYPNSALNHIDLSILRNLGSSLGISDREDQIKHLSLTGEQLKNQLEKAEIEAGRHVKMWNYFGFLGGLVIVLILF